MTDSVTNNPAACCCPDPLREIHPGCPLHGHSPEKYQAPASAATVRHDRTRHPHSVFSSFTCPACIQRCLRDDEGRGVLGRPHIAEHADQWAKEDGYAD